MNPLGQPTSGTPTADPALEAYLLGTIGHEAARLLQRLLVYQITGDRNRAALVLCEHPPLITIGREGSRAHIDFEPDELAARDWSVRWVNRGGGCQLYLPGQLVIYAVLPLDRLGLGLRDYIDRLQQVLIDVLADFSVAGEKTPDRSLVLVGNRPIAQVGVAVRDWVSYHGAVLNVHPDLLPFRRLRTGPADAPMTSLERERHGPLRFAQVRERFLEHFAHRFGFARTSLFFQHPALAPRAASGQMTGQK